MGFDFGAGERRMVDYTRRVARYNVVHTGLEKLELKPHRVVVDKPYPEVRWTATSNT
jgi:hypothetical protein